VRIATTDNAANRPFALSNAKPWRDEEVTFPSQLVFCRPTATVRPPIKTGRGFILLLHLLFVTAGRSQTASFPDVLWLAHERAESLKCWGQLRSIGLAARTWQSENGGAFPSGFSVLTNELGAPSALYCPSHYRRDSGPTNWSSFEWDTGDYTWITPTNLSDPAAVFCQCKIHRNVGRMDGSVDLIFGFRPGWPRILAPPLNQLSGTGSLVRFEFVLTNAASPFQLQWNREDPYWRTNLILVVTNYETGEGYWQNFYVGTNTPIPGATNAVFEIASAVTNDAGYYSVTISNFLGAAKTHLERLYVTPPVTRIPLTEVQCRNRLKMISIAAGMWAQDHGDTLPSHLGEMTNDIGYPMFGWPILLYCPSDTNRLAPASWSAVDFTNTSYEVLPTNPMQDYWDPPCYDQPFARCRVHGFVVLGDGTIEPALTLNPASIVRTNGQVRFIVQNPANRNFQIQASTNLVDWTDLLTVSNAIGPIPFTDPATNVSRRFYRARLVD
jgi:hypothetical protein